MNARWREQGSYCPKNGGDFASLEPNRCGGCRFFRGASHGPHEPLKMLCNWPVSGSYVEPEFSKEHWERMMRDGQE